MAADWLLGHLRDRGGVAARVVDVAAADLPTSLLVWWGREARQRRPYAA